MNSKGEPHPRPLAPQVADLVARIKRANRPPYWRYTPQEARVFHDRASGILDIPSQPVAAVTDLRIPVGAEDIAARMYQGTGAGEPSPLVIFAHGGGFTVGSIHSYDALCRMLANGAACKVLSLDYRLAPEHRFPTAAEDVFAAWQWVFAEYESLGVDRLRIVGMGDSAGGTLTAQAALRARDAGLPLAAQVLVYPGTSSWHDTGTHHAYAEGYLLDARTVQWFFDNYLRDDADRMDWRFAPLNAPEFLGVAPALIQLAECDPIMDEGMAYAAKLESAGTAVRTLVYPGTVHAFYGMGGALELARQAHRDTVDYLRAVFGISNRT